MRVCVLLLLSALPALAGPRGAAFSAHQQTAVVARAGDSAALRCRVLRLADRAVSWVRSSDLQILTHAGAVFTADARVACSEAPAGPDQLDEGPDPSDDWSGELRGADDILISRDDGWNTAGTVHTLKIERVRVSDSGRYECQINTEPKLSIFFNLTVVESSLPLVQVRALGTVDGTVRARAESAARLSCEARYEPPPPPGVLAALPPLRLRWSHDGQDLDPQSSRGGISLDTERWAGRAVSRLTLAAVRAADAGRYRCEPLHAPERAATVLLRVRGTGDDYEDGDGELGAMQRDQAEARVGSAADAEAHCSLLPLLMLLLVIFLT